MNFQNGIDKTAREELFWKSKEKAIGKIFQEYWRDEIMLNSNQIDDFVPDCHAKKFHEYVGKRSGKRHKYIMFTINFSDDVMYEVALKKYMKYRVKKWIVDEIGCFEWRRGDKGMHIHSRVELSKDKNPYECKREVYNTFKGLVGNKYHVNARYGNDKDCFIEYIKGYRKGVKKEGFDNNERMREKYNTLY